MDWEIGIDIYIDWASLMAQMVKNPPAMLETWAQSLVGKIPWRRERLPTPIFWPREFHGLCSPWDQIELDMTEQLSLSYKFNLVFLVKTSFMIGKSYCTKAVHHIASK